MHTSHLSLAFLPLFALRFATMLYTNNLLAQLNKPAAHSAKVDTNCNVEKDDDNDTALLTCLGDAISSSQKTVFTFFRAKIELPNPFVALAFRFAQKIRANQPGSSYSSERYTVNELLSYVNSLLNTDSSRLEAAMLTLHGLSMVVACPKSTATESSTGEQWELQWRLLSEESRTLMRESLELFQTMCEPACKPLTLWFFENQLSSHPHFPFSALLGRFTPAHVRGSVQYLTNVLNKAMSQTEALTCIEFNELFRAIPRPLPKRKRDSVKKPPTFRQRGIKMHRSIATAVLVIAEAMDSEEQEQFMQLAENLPLAPLIEDGIRILALPGMRKRLRLNESALY